MDFCFVIKKTLAGTTITGSTLAASQKPKTMERQEDALNKQREQSISYYGTINIPLVDGEQEDADSFYTFGENAQINRW